MNPKYYRPDIDGLRAIAVLAVIFYHLGTKYLPGGFIGVDIFFVISGYLITSIITREISESRFSLLQFWERRVRRIFPALFLVITFTSITAFFVFLYPNDFLEFGRSLIAQSLFLINIFFMRQEDYFAAPVDTIPLLHTWSLAVEEQFYVVFPLMLLLIHKLGRHFLLPTLLTLAITSFLLSVYFSFVIPGHIFTIPGLPHVWGGATNATAAFYILPTRAWELLTGAILTLITIKPKSAIQAETLAYLGLLLLVNGLVFTTKHSPFPGYIALLPVIGTALIIFANTSYRTTTARLLSYRPLVGIGLISYALYLWHWPIIVFSHYLTLPLSTGHLNLAILLLTFILATLTYFLIETPFRHKKILAERTHLFWAAGVGLSIFLSTGIYIHSEHGLPKRAPESAAIIAEAITNVNPRRYECFQNNYHQLTPGSDPCLMGTSNSIKDISFVLWGDSQADTIMPAFDQAAHDLGITGAFFAIGGCAPLLHNPAVSRDEKCEQLKHAVTNFVINNNVAQIFLVSAWSPTYITTGNESITLENLLNETISRLQKGGLQITLIDTPPSQTMYNDRQAFIRLAHGDFNSLTPISTKHFLSQSAGIHDALEKLTDSNVHILFPHQILCNDEICSLTEKDKILYRDSTHLNTSGAMKLYPLFRDALRNK